MIDIEPTNIRRNWQECPREAKEARWAQLYATMNPDGDIIISRYTHEKLGAPDSYVLLFDREREVIGLRPARMDKEKNAYPARKRGNYGGRRIRGYRLCREFGIRIGQTVRFPRCQLDNRGILLLDLKDTRPANRRRNPRTDF